MPLLKRFEVWLLIVLSLGAAFWVIRTDKAADDGPPPSPADPALASTDSADGPALKIHRCTLERDYGNARLDIELRYRHSGPRPLILQPPDVRLLTSDGQEVPPFVLPVEKAPQMPAHSTQDLRLRFWLDKSHLQGGLTLDVLGEKAEVKAATPLDLETLENKSPKTWPGAIP